MNRLLKKFLFLFLTSSAMAYAQAAPQVPAQPSTPSSQTVEEWKHSIPQEEEKKVEPTNFTTLFVKMLLLLGLSLGFLFLLAFIGKRFVSGRMLSSSKTGRIKVVEQKVLSQKTTISILEIDEQSIAIAESHNGITVLRELPKKIISEGDV
jgi:flagellar biogenesis protein FliO